MPNKSMASNKLSVCLRKLNDSFTAGETEDSSALLCRIPLHAVSGCELAELLVVGQD